MHFGNHVGDIGHPFASRRPVIKRIGIRVEDYALELTTYHPFKHIFESLVLVGKLHIGPHLRAGVPQPHGMNIAGIYKRIVLSIIPYAIMYGGIKGIGITVFKHPCQFRIDKHGFNFSDTVIHSL